MTVHEWLPYRYDEIADLLGGKTWEILLEDLQRQYELDRLDNIKKKDALTPFSSYLFACDSDEALLLEVLYAKLSLFSQLCRAVARYQAGLERPVYDLNPTKIWLDVGVSEKTPLYWQLKLKLANIDNVIPQRESGLRPLINEHESTAYVHPALLDFATSELNAGRLTITDLQQGAQGEITAQAILDTMVMKSDQVGYNRVELFFGREQGFQNAIEIEADIKQRQRARLEIELHVTKFSKTDQAQLQTIASVPGMQINYRPKRNLDESLDRYSLGMILFRTLLVNKSQDINLVASRVNEITTNWTQNTEQQQAILKQLSNDAVMSPANLWMDSRSGHLPRSLWQSILILGFDMVSQTSPLTLAQCIDSVDLNLDKLHQGMFAGMGEMQGDLRQVLADIINDPNWLNQLHLPPDSKKVSSVSNSTLKLPPNKPASQSESQAEKTATLPQSPKAQKVTPDMLESTIMMAGGMAFERPRASEQPEGESPPTNMFADLEKTIQQKQEDITDSKSPQPTINVADSIDKRSIDATLIENQDVRKQKNKDAALRRRNERVINPPSIDMNSLPGMAQTIGTPKGNRLPQPGMVKNEKIQSTLGRSVANNPRDSSEDDDDPDHTIIIKPDKPK